MEHRRLGLPSKEHVRLALASVALVLALAGCDEYGVNAQGLIVREHAPRVTELIREDLASARVGIRTCAERVAPGFSVEDPEQRSTEIRAALSALRDIEDPRHRIPELVASPISFVAAVGMDGVVIARDLGEDRDAPDQMAGISVAALAPLRRALDEGVEADGIVDFPGFTPEDPTLPMFFFAVPITRGGERRGALVGGIPLWREAQKLSRQLQAENADGTILWVYLYRGADVLHHGTPGELDESVPDPEERATGLASSPGGYTRGFLRHGRWFALGVLPMPAYGEDTGAVIVRSDPP